MWKSPKSNLGWLLLAALGVAMGLWHESHPALLFFLSAAFGYFHSCYVSSKWWECVRKLHNLDRESAIEAFEEHVTQ